jgi:hypothetical protein
MATITPKALTLSLSKRLANFKLSDTVIKSLAERMLVEGLEIIRFNPCIYGICIDYWTVKPPVLDPFWRHRGVARLEVFPYGILEWDRWHVQAAFEVDELEGRGVVREMGF